MWSLAFRASIRVDDDKKLLSGRCVKMALIHLRSRRLFIGIFVAAFAVANISLGILKNNNLGIAIDDSLILNIFFLLKTLNATNTEMTTTTLLARTVEKSPQNGSPSLYARAEGLQHLALTRATADQHSGPQKFSRSQDLVSPSSPPRRPKRTKGTLYRCGFETQTGRLPHLLFDDYLDDNHQTNFSLPVFQCKHKYTPDDILVLTGGYCCGRLRFYYQRHSWLRTSFPGRVLFVNAESYADGTGNRSYMISSMAPHERNVQVTFAAMALIGLISRDKWPIITWKDHPRPRNTGKHFLAYVTTFCVEFRQNVALALSQLGLIHHGTCKPKLNDDSNFTSIPSNFSGHFEWTRNIDLFHNYRFCFVSENGVQPYYVTEKLVMAFMAGCVPIWYGTTDVWDIFHKDAFLFVDAENPEAIKELVGKVRYLEENDTAYNEMFQYPILANGNATLEKYFSLDDSIGNGHLKHKIRMMMGLEDEQYRQIS